MLHDVCACWHADLICSTVCGSQIADSDWVGALITVMENTVVVIAVGLRQ